MCVRGAFTAPRPQSSAELEMCEFQCVAAPAERVTDLMPPGLAEHRSFKA